MTASMGTITSLVPVRGGVLFAATDPAIGLLDSQGFQVFTQMRPTLNFRGIDNRLQVSPRGGTVQFPLDRHSGRLARFNVEKLQLVLNSRSDSRLSSGKTRSSAFRLKGWRSGRSAGLMNGEPVKLYKGERPLVYTVAPNDRFLVIGTSSHLRLYDHTGRVRWRMPVPGPVYGVVVTSDNRRIVAALGDGTIRWYRVTRGAEILALFVHSDQKRWVAWTPRKFYAVSLGGEGLVGWQKNRGKGRSAKYLSSDRIAGKYHRPKRIQKLLLF